MARGAFAGLTAAASLAACAPQASQTVEAPAAIVAPTVSVASIDDLPAPLPKPYDDTASADETMARVDAAFISAGDEDKRVIVDLGGNWCSWCRILASVMDLPEVKPFMEQHFVVVSVPVSSKQGLTDQNIPVLKRFGLTDVDGVPWLIVAEPDGTVLNSSYEITDENHETPQAMVNWLASYAKPVEANS